MREILFRGKRSDNGEWVEGSLFVFPNTKRTKILVWNQADLDFDAIEVSPETVGQFTGLTDKNGTKIFEWDIVEQTFEKTVVYSAQEWSYGEYADLYGTDVGVVVILPSKGTCIKNPIIHREVNGEITQDKEVAKMYKPICSGRCEIIGNIHDSPELLEAK